MIRLTRIFHTDRDEEVAKADEARRKQILTQGCMITYRSSHNLLPTQHSSAFPASTVDRYEICGLATLFFCAIALGLTGCAHQLPTYEKPLQRAAIQKVRTTAYTHSEKDHHRYGSLSALGTPLRHGAINSAAADWSRWPAGTRFRIRATGEIFVIDDYGFALAGTNTIDLYKPTRAAMCQWGVRRVTIEILEWGDPWRSYMLMMKVKSYRHIHRMLKEIKCFFPNHCQAPQPVVSR